MASQRERLLPMKNNSDTRLALLEQNIIYTTQILDRIDKRLEKIEVKIEEVDQKININHEKIIEKIDNNNKWLFTTFITAFLGLMSVIVNLATHFFK